MIVAVLMVFNFGQRLRYAMYPHTNSIAVANANLHEGSFHAGLTVGDFKIRRSGSVQVASASPENAPQESSDSNQGSNSDPHIDDVMSNDSPPSTFEQVYLLLKNEYVDQIDSDDQKLAHGAASAMIMSLDEPNSRFLEQPERQALEQQENGLFSGSGAIFTVRRITDKEGVVRRDLTIIDTVPGSSAEKAGLKTGDTITEIDSHWIIGYDPFQAQAALFKKLTNNQFDLGKAIDATEKKISDGYSLAKAQTVLDTPSDKPVVLTVSRPGEPKPFSITITQMAPVQVKDVESKKLASGAGYIGINLFTSSTAKDFADALNGLGQINGLVIDLRDCPGGSVSPAAEIAHSLNPASVFGDVQIRGADESKADKAKPLGFDPIVRPLTADTASPELGIAINCPISVLVNGGTANTAELFAAFLHDQMDAQVIGSTTFGDGSAQTLFPLSDGSAFVLTTGVLKTDHGLAFNSAGLAPDVMLAAAGHSGDTDDQAVHQAVDSLNSNHKMAHSGKPLQAAHAVSDSGGLTL